MKKVIHILFLIFLPVTLFAQVNKVAGGKVTDLTIRVHFSDETKKDTLKIAIYSSYVGTAEKGYEKYVKAALRKDSLFKFKIPVKSKYGYFEIFKLRSKNAKAHYGMSDPDQAEAFIQRFYWEQGDNIQIKLIKGDNKTYHRLFSDYKISGIGSKKYIVKLKADSAYMNAQNTNQVIFDSKMTFHDNLENNIREAIKVINAHKSELSNSSYNVLKADYLYTASTVRFYDILDYYKRNISKLSDTLRIEFIKCVEHQQNAIIENSGIPKMFLDRSYGFLNYIFDAARTNFQLKSVQHSNYDPTSIDDRVNYFMRNKYIDDSVYYFLKNKYSGFLRDKIIGNLLGDGIGFRPSNPNSIINDAINSIQTSSFYKNQIRTLSLPRHLGSPVYDFNLPDTMGKYYSISDFKGKVVLIDFYFTGCSGCLGLYKNTISPVEKYFENNNKVAFLSISVDVDKNLWRSGIKSGKYTDKNGLVLYTDGKGDSHSLIKYYGMTEFPTTLLMDKFGRISRYNSGDLYNKDSLIETINRTLSQN